MAAYLIAFVKINDPTKFQEYAAAAGPTIAAAGGSVVARGKVMDMLAGNLNADASLVAKFASIAAAQAWYQSPEYQALISLRDQAVTPTFVLIEEPT